MVNLSVYFLHNDCICLFSGQMVVFVMATATISLICAMIAVFLDSKTDATRVPNIVRIVAFKYLAKVLCVADELEEPSDHGLNSTIKVQPFDDIVLQEVTKDKIDPNNPITYFRDMLMEVKEIKSHLKRAERSDAIINKWKLLSKLIDRLLFWLSLFVVIIYLIVVAVELESAN